MILLILLVLIRFIKGQDIGPSLTIYVPSISTSSSSSYSNTPWVMAVPTTASYVAPVATPISTPEPVPEPQVEGSLWNDIIEMKPNGIGFVVGMSSAIMLVVSYLVNRCRQHNLKSTLRRNQRLFDNNQTLGYHNNQPSYSNGTLGSRMNSETGTLYRDYYDGSHNSQSSLNHGGSPGSNDAGADISSNSLNHHYSQSSLPARAPQLGETMANLNKMTQLNRMTMKPSDSGLVDNMSRLESVERALSPSSTPSRDTSRREREQKDYFSFRDI